MSDPVTTSPVVAQCYVFQSGDTIVHVSSGDAGGTVALANILKPDGRVGRTTSAAIEDGWQITLATELIGSVSFIELVNLADGTTGTTAPLTAGMKIILLGKDSVPTNTINTQNQELVIPSELFTGHDLIHNRPIRPNWILGYDDLFAPVKGTPPALVAVDCETILFQFKSTGVSYVETEFCGIGIDAKTLAEIPLKNINPVPVELFDGFGYSWTISWESMPKTDAIYLTELWKTSGRGNYPIFFFPAAGVKDTTGLLTEAWASPIMRGGLMRMLSFTHSGYRESASAWEAVNCVLKIETWQAHPTKGSV